MHILFVFPYIHKTLILASGIREKLKTEYLLEAMRTREKWLLEKAIETAREAPSVAADNPVLREAETELEIVRLKEGNYLTRFRVA